MNHASAFRAEEPNPEDWEGYSSQPRYVSPILHTAVVIVSQAAQVVPLPSRHTTRHGTSTGKQRRRNVYRASVSA